MPFPISVKGKQYATSASDYAYGINKNSSTTNQEAAHDLRQVADREVQLRLQRGGVSIAADDDKLPDLYSDFKNVKLIADEPAPDGEEDLFNDLNSRFPNSTSTPAATPVSRASSSTRPIKTSPTTTSSRSGTRSGTTPLIPKASTPSDSGTPGVTA